MPMLSKHVRNIYDIFASFKVCLAALATKVSMKPQSVYEVMLTLLKKCGADKSPYFFCAL